MNICNKHAINIFNKHTMNISVGKRESTMVGEPKNTSVEEPENISMFYIFSMFSKLTPCSPIQDCRIPMRVSQTFYFFGRIFTSSPKWNGPKGQNELLAFHCKAGNVAETITEIDSLFHFVRKFNMSNANSVIWPGDKTEDCRLRKCSFVDARIAQHLISPSYWNTLS